MPGDSPVERDLPPDGWDLASPGVVRASVNRRAAHESVGEDARAVPDYDEPIRLDPDIVGFHFNCGNANAKVGRVERALADYGEAIYIYPEYAAAYYNRGMVQWSLGNDEAAQAYVDRAAELGLTP